MDEVSIQLAEPEDAEMLTDISTRSFNSDAEVGAPGKGGPPGYDSVETQKRAIQATWGEYLKIMYDEKIVGGTTVIKISDTHHEIVNVFIDPNFHRMGIGTQSFELIKARYPKVKKWTLDTPDWNTRTKAYYERLEFEQYGIFRWAPSFELRAYQLLLDPDYVVKITKIVDVVDNDQRYIIEGIIESISEAREVFSKKDNKHHRIADVILNDSSSTIKIVLWDDMIRQIKSGERIRIETAYVSTFRDEMQLNVSKFGRIAILH
ncbi:MAG: GNAT family N-acetyltransferase [Candidatus Thorarchaeota archaeon]